MAQGINEFKATIKSLIGNSLGIVTIRKLSRDYHTIMGVDIPFRNFGFTSLEIFLRTLHDTVLVKGVGSNAQLFAIHNEKPKYFIPYVGIRKTKQRRRSRTRSTRKSSKPSAVLTTKTTEVITEKAIPVPVKSRVSNSPHPQTRRSKTIQYSNMEISYPQSPLMERKHGTANGNNMKKRENQKKIEQSSDALPDLNKSFVTLTLLDFLFDEVAFKYEIPSLDIHKSIGNSVFLIQITEIHNPYKFWFNFLKDDQYDLDALMEDIEKFYSKLEENAYRMQNKYIRSGQICCVLFEKSDLWFRAEILNDTLQHKVKVMFIDYGIISYVSTKNIKYLLKEFTKLPRQALRGSLAHIRPIGDRWSRNATLSFISMTSNLLLYAKSTEINYKDNVIEVLVVNTNGDKDVKINEELINQGYAKYYPPNSSKSTEFADRKRLFSEIYPSFDMLEKGKYPSFSEIGDYLSKGIDYEKMEDESILPEVGDQSISDYITKLLYYDESNDNDDHDGSSEEKKRVIL